MNHVVKVAVIATTQILIIILMVAYHFNITANGTEVLLKIAPVDPTDLFRGDYVTFQYDISTLEEDLFSEQVSSGSKIYVPLKQDGKYWSAQKGISTSKPSSGIFLKGVVQYSTSIPISSPTTEINNTTNLTSSSSSGMVSQADLNSSTIAQQNIRREYRSAYRIEYGIEQYFIPEGSGRQQDFRNREVGVNVRISYQGDAVVTGVLLDGTQWPRVN